MAVVFTDTFDVTGDTNIDAYPSGSPDYAYITGSGSNISVNATNDRLQVGVTTTDVAARIINAAAPTGDQEITATIDNDGGSYHSILVRCAAGSANYYRALFQPSDTPDITLYRVTNGSGTVIATRDNGIGIAAHTIRLKATGTTPVDLEVQVDATTVLTFSDADADRKQTGTPGVHLFGNVDVGWIDNISVDNLVDALEIPTADGISVGDVRYEQV